MKRILNYKTFINENSRENNLTPEQIGFLNKYVIGKWKLNDVVVDVDGDFDCSGRGISDFKGIRFGKVSGDFDCSHNNLTSLEGCPKEVGGSFYCNYNNLTSLEGCPKEVGGTFNCNRNNLTSLKGCPEKLNGIFHCSNNNLTSLEGAPKEVGGALQCSYNEGISAETIGLIFDKMGRSGSAYKTVLKSLWKEIPIGDKIFLYTPDLDWVDADEAAKLSNLKKYDKIKKMI